MSSLLAFAFCDEGGADRMIADTESLQKQRHDIGCCHRNPQTRWIKISQVLVDPYRVIVLLEANRSGSLCPG
jgi:hypothetical protein